MYRMILFFLCMAVSQSALASGYDLIESRGEMFWMIPGMLFLVGGIIGFFLHMGIVALRKKPTEISLNMSETKGNGIIHEDNKIIPPIPMVGPSISDNTSEVLVGSDVSSQKLFVHPSSSAGEDNMSEVLVSKDVTGDEAISTVPEEGEDIVIPVSQEDPIRITPLVHQDSIGPTPSQSVLSPVDATPVLSASHDELLSSPAVLPELTAPEEQNLLISRELPELLDVVSQNQLPQSAK